MKKFNVRFEASKNTLFISADFAKKTSDPRSAEYCYLCDLLRKNPSMKIEKRTRIVNNRLTCKDMEAKLRRIDQNGKLVEAFKLVVEIGRLEKVPYAYVYNWYKKQMEVIKAEKENEKKTSASNKEELMKKLDELTAGISYDTSADVEEMEEEKEYEKEEVSAPH